MFYIRHMLVLCLCVWTAGAACAFSFSYGTFFDVSGAKHQEGVLQMPLSKGKYKDVKVLSKELYDFLTKCQRTCHYPVQAVTLQTVDYRQAFTRQNMLIADVDFNKDLALTFLVFKNKDGFFIQYPKTVIFKDKKLQKQVDVHLKKLAEQTL